MNHKIVEIDQTSELFPQSLLAIGADCPEKLCLMGNVDLLKAEKGGGRNGSGNGTILPAARLFPLTPSCGAHHSVWPGCTDGKERH